MATKTFKSEYHMGGEIKVTTDTKKNEVVILNCGNTYKYDTRDSRVRSQLDRTLFELTSSYYAEVIIKWIESKIKLSEVSFW